MNNIEFSSDESYKGYFCLVECDIIEREPAFIINKTRSLKCFISVEGMIKLVRNLKMKFDYNTYKRINEGNFGKSYIINYEKKYISKCPVCNERLGDKLVVSGVCRDFGIHRDCKKEFCQSVKKILSKNSSKLVARNLTELVAR
jgi:hypothetical protein